VVGTDVERRDTDHGLRDRLTPSPCAEEINAVVASLGNLLMVLRGADPADKAEIYRGLGLELTYHAGAK